jgi:hypothetical protein
LPPSVRLTAGTQRLRYYIVFPLPPTVQIGAAALGHITALPVAAAIANSSMDQEYQALEVVLADFRMLRATPPDGDRLWYHSPSSNADRRARAIWSASVSIFGGSS